jgi:nitrite reductase/ring-hydroxylating ferredoxin subunit
MSWVKVLDAPLGIGDRQVVTAGDRKILVLNHQGQHYAINNACPHLKLPMKNGKITEDGAIVCPWHRSTFDLATGAVKAWTPWPPVMGAVMAKVSTEKAIATFATKIENNQLWVEIMA